MIDITICVLNIVISIIGCYISVNVKNNIFPVYFSCFSGILLSILWAFAARYTGLKLIVTSALFSAICEIGYCIGFFLMGTQISMLNFWGIIFMLAGILLLHF